VTTDRDDDTRALFWEAMGNAFRPYAGWIFFGFGALLVTIGYFGISGEAVVAKQLPYLISGGLGGVLLAILGGYFLAIEELRKDGGRLDRMERQIEQLHQALLDRPDAPRELVVAPLPTGASAESNGNGTSHRVLVVESGESFHRPGCALTAGKEATELDRSAASARGLRPCPVCEAVPATS
jgi:hypothetical protein